MSETFSIVSWLEELLLKAIEQGASDLHFEPYENNYRIRIRYDGVLKEVTTLPISSAVRVTARIKVLSQLDISERRLPQDGRFKITPPNAQPIDFRVSSCPTLFGEKVVIRILDPNRLILDLPSLGYERFQEQLFLERIHRTQGLILVTGPTGSGKTMSLYAALNILNTDLINISTAEDPIEVHMVGLNQVPIQPKIGLSFSTALQTFLRQDPDVMMIGEIRDTDTATMAVQASQTGHLVLSTLHTNNAAETLTRLMSLGISTFNLATSVTLIIAQRLLRRLCHRCKRPSTTADIFHAVGCLDCHQGYKGRVGVYEMMSITPSLAQIISSGGHACDIIQQAHLEGMQFLYDSGLEKVRQGITSLEEVKRILL